MNLQVGDYVTTDTNVRGKIRALIERETETIAVILTNSNECYCCPLENINEYTGE